MSKVRISPLLNSLFNRTDLMTKDEANVLVDSLSVVGSEKVSMSLAQTGFTNSNYVIVYGEENLGDTASEVTEVLSENGWETLSSQKRGNEGFWVYFNRK